MKKTVKFQIVLFVIAVLGLMIRLYISHEIFSVDKLSASPPSYTDMYTYQQLSLQFFGGTFDKSFYYQPFYYTVFLPCVYIVLDKNIWSILIAHSILGALTIWLTGMSAASIRSRRAGVIAAILMSCSLMSVFYTAFMLIVTLKAFLIALFVFLSINAFSHDKWYQWASLGIICSCLVLTRANVIVFLPLLIIFSYFIRRRSVFSPPNSPMRVFWAKIAPAFLILALFLLPQIYFIYHNSAIEGKLTPPSTAGSANLAIGNNPEACPAGLSYTQTSQYWNRHADEISVPLRIIRWLKKEPMQVMELTFRKILIFWDSGTVFDNMTHFEKSWRSSSFLTYFPFIPTPLYLIGFLSYIFLLRKKIIRDKKQLFLCLMVLFYCLTVVAFINLTRYRLAILPILAIFTALYIDKIIYSIRKPKKSMKLILIVIFVTVFVYGGYPFYRFYLEKYIIALIQPNGVQIELGSDKVYIDNGPKSMGAWTTFPIMIGNPITKQFVIDDKDIGKNAEFHLTLFKTEKKAIQININGKAFNSFSLKNNLTLRFKLKVPKDGIFIIEPKISKLGTVLAYCDLQRNFGRTAVNNRSLNGELVCRLIVDRSENVK